MVPLLTSKNLSDAINIVILFVTKKTITKKGYSKDVTKEKLVTKIMFKTKNYKRKFLKLNYCKC